MKESLMGNGRQYSSSPKKGAYPHVVIGRETHASQPYKVIIYDMWTLVGVSESQSSFSAGDVVVENERVD